jgi:alkanesulfonate monooxygenase SsuD/methylene tetrahydromethanopterin reductase-like flavin-dependent oxidoreductase (luciferase family)
MDRLGEVLAVARGLWSDGAVDHEGRHVVARDLPLSPVPQQPPRLLVGGGSDRLLELAGRLADLVDLHGDPKHGRVAGATMARAAAGDVARRAHTTVEDLAGRVELVRDAAVSAGRPRDAVGVATQIWYVAFGSPAQVRAAEEELCSRWAGIPYRRLDRSPYLLFGSPAQMAEALAERREAYGLQRISLSEEGGIAAAPPDPLRFCREVLPLLG